MFEGLLVRMISVLSPHRDDAAFSCGLLLTALVAARAEIQIINVCTRSTYAPYVDVPVNDALSFVTEKRRHEDEIFMMKLGEEAGVPGSEIKLLDLSWLDAPERLDVATESVLTPQNLNLEELTRMNLQLEEFASSDLVIAPLALGGHIDHRLVNASALSTFPPERLLLYEDLPYASRMSPRERLLEAESLPWSSRTFPHAGSPGRKERYGLCYPSQIEESVAREMELYCEALGGRERYFGSAMALQRLEQYLRKSEATS